MFKKCCSSLIRCPPPHHAEQARIIWKWEKQNINMEIVLLWKSVFHFSFSSTYPRKYREKRHRWNGRRYIFNLYTRKDKDKDTDKDEHKSSVGYMLSYATPISLIISLFFLMFRYTVYNVHILVSYYSWYLLYFLLFYDFMLYGSHPCFNSVITFFMLLNAERVSENFSHFLE